MVITPPAEFVKPFQRSILLCAAPPGMAIVPNMNRIIIKAVFPHPFGICENLHNFLHRKYIKYAQKILDSCIKLRYILYGKTESSRKIAMRLKEKEILQQFISSPELYDPLKITRYEVQPPVTQDVCPDAVIEFSIPAGPSFKAMVKIQPVPTPKQIFLMFSLLRNFVGEMKNAVPMVIAPYIGKRQAKTLAEQGVSWIDLCGNMMVQVSGKIYIERTGNKNKFPDTAPIKKIFQGTSSLISRALLLKPEGFGTQYELVDFINNRNANITAGTVSRVLKSLEEELLVRKTKSLITAMDTEKLLDKLTKGYVDYTKRQRTKTYKFAADEINKIFYIFFERQVNFVACGFYAAKLKGLATTKQVTIFVRDIEQAKKTVEFQMVEMVPDSEFGQLCFIETKDPCVWFNNSKAQPFVPAAVDDIELYLEMMADTPRGPKVAELLKPRILKGQVNG